jgi:hypothetical protein
MIINNNISKKSCSTRIKLFSKLTPTIRSLKHDVRVFKPAIKKNLLTPTL